MELKTQPTIRRRPNGTIDVDHYREAAIIMRRHASVDMMRGVRPALGSIAAAFLLLLSFALFAQHKGPSQVAMHSPVTSSVPR
jgi:hypothetical protein